MAKKRGRVERTRLFNLLVSLILFSVQWICCFQSEFLRGNLIEICESVELDKKHPRFFDVAETGNLGVNLWRNAKTKLFQVTKLGSFK